MLTEDLNPLQAKMLLKCPQDLERVWEKVLKACWESVKQLEKDLGHRIKEFNFQPGHLVLVQNSCFDKALMNKMKPLFLGPMVVIQKMKGGSYILGELDGALWAPPLYWGMWAPSITSQLPQKRGCSISCSSPFQRDVGAQEGERRGKGRGKEACEKGKTRWWRRGTQGSEQVGNHNGWRTQLGEFNTMSTNGGKFHPKMKGQCEQNKCG